jgi:hypothetical protein
MHVGRKFTAADSKILIHGGNRRPMQSRLCIICKGYHLHGRASVCVCGGDNAAMEE